MDNILVALISACGGAVVAVIGQLIVWALNRKAQKTDRNANIEEGVQLLLQDRIKYLAKSYIADGEIHAEDLEDIVHMHEAYHDLGGNGYLDTLMSAVKGLKIIK